MHTDHTPAPPLASYYSDPTPDAPKTLLLMFGLTRPIQVGLELPTGADQFIISPQLETIKSHSQKPSAANSSSSKGHGWVLTGSD